MQDRAHTQRQQRKTRDRSVVLLILGAVLLLPPVGSIALVQTSLLGIPMPVFYVFCVWAFLIAAAAALAPSLEGDTDEQDSTAVNNMDVES